MNKINMLRINVSPMTKLKFISLHHAAKNFQIIISYNNNDIVFRFADIKLFFS